MERLPQFKAKLEKVSLKNKPIFERWTEQCSELYIHKGHGVYKMFIFGMKQPRRHCGREILFDNILTELFQAEDETMIYVMTSICNKVW